MLNSEIIRSTDNLPGLSPDKKILALGTVTYQDAGNYTCIASNGVPKGGVIEQTGSTYISVHGNILLINCININGICTIV